MEQHPIWFLLKEVKIVKLSRFLPKRSNYIFVPKNINFFFAGGISAFEPVTSMGMNINNLPPVTVSAGPFVSSQYPGPYSQGL